MGSPGPGSFMLTTKLDMTNYRSRVATWSKAVGVSMREGLQIQVGLLVKDLVAGAAPKNLNKAQKRAERDVKRLFAAGPITAFPQEQRGGKRGIFWLASGPEWIYGVEPPDLQPHASLDQMRRIYSESRNQPRGKAWLELGKRGKQKAMRLDRIVVGAAKLQRFIKNQMQRFGLQKAAWGVGWDILQVRGRLPQWIRKHITSGEAKGVMLNNLSAPKPSVTIISRATGVERASSLRMVRGAIKKRAAAMLKDMKLYLNGTKKRAGFAKT